MDFLVSEVVTDFRYLKNTTSYHMGKTNPTIIYLLDFYIWEDLELILRSRNYIVRLANGAYMREDVIIT